MNEPTEEEIRSHPTWRVFDRYYRVMRETVLEAVRHGDDPVETINRCHDAAVALLSCISLDMANMPAGTGDGKHQEEFASLSHHIHDAISSWMYEHQLRKIAEGG